jgi:hypothetical protein
MGKKLQAPSSKHQRNSKHQISKSFEHLGSKRFEYVRGVRLEAWGVSGYTRAAEGRRTPRRFAKFEKRAHFRRVLECGCPLPLSLELPELICSFNRIPYVGEL